MIHPLIRRFSEWCDAHPRLQVVICVAAALIIFALDSPT